MFDELKTLILKNLRSLENKLRDLRTDNDMRFREKIFSCVSSEMFCPGTASPAAIIYGVRAYVWMKVYGNAKDPLRKWDAGIAESGDS